MNDKAIANPRRPSEQSNRDRSKWVEVFEKQMLTMAQMYRVTTILPGTQAQVPGFPFAVKALFMRACEGWSKDKMRAVFEKVMQSEKFCPTLATFKAYGEGVRDAQARPVVEAFKAPTFTPDERADIDWMKADLAAKFKRMAWS